MNLIQEVHSRGEEFLRLCQLHNVKALYAFGSAITDRFNENSSDIDLLVEVDEIDPIERGEKLMSLWNKFEEFFNRRVDLLTDSSIKNPVLRKSIDKTKMLIYDGRRQKVLV